MRDERRVPWLRGVGGGTWALIYCICQDRGKPVSILTPIIPSLTPFHLLFSFLASVLTHFSSPAARGQSGLSGHRLPLSPVLLPHTIAHCVISSQQLQRINTHNLEERFLVANPPEPVCQRCLSDECDQPEGCSGHGGHAVCRGLLSAQARAVMSNTSPLPWCPLMNRRQDS